MARLLKIKAIETAPDNRVVATAEALHYWLHTPDGRRTYLDLGSGRDTDLPKLIHCINELRLRKLQEYIPNCNLCRGTIQTTKKDTTP